MYVCMTVLTAARRANEYLRYAYMYMYIHASMYICIYVYMHVCV